MLITFLTSAFILPILLRMGSSQSSQSSTSSLEVGNASIISPRSSSNGLGNAAIASTTGDGSVVAMSAVQGNGDVASTSSYNDQASESISHSSYEQPSTPIQPLVHYIFLVHGWLGNDLEFGYLAEAFQNSIGARNDDNASSNGHAAKRIRRSDSPKSTALAAASTANTFPRPDIVVHSVKCNVGKTHDGIRKGGTRLADEMIKFIRSDVQKRLGSADENGKNEEYKNNKDDKEQTSSENTNAQTDNDSVSTNKHVTFSIIGNSLGGLYARYALSLVPYQLKLTILQQQRELDQHSRNIQLNLHPNVFCTTATPHLGVSQHTYLPIPRFAEQVIGSGMGATGRDLFRLNSDNYPSNSNGGEEGGNERGFGVGQAIGNGVSAGISFGGGMLQRGFGIFNSKDEGSSNGYNGRDDEEMGCVIRDMCLQEKFLAPLRNFRHRIAYANAYGTDFQVPTETAAFLHGESEVKHTVVAARKHRDSNGTSGDSSTNDNEDDSTTERSGMEINPDGEVALPPFVLAIVQTEQLPQPKEKSIDKTTSNELLQMSKSLDSLGWIKVFIDVRNNIPIPGISIPSWLRPTSASLLEELIEKKTAEKSPSADSSNGDTQKSQNAESPCCLTSKELAQSTSIGDSLHFPMGHTVMVANSKSEAYSKLNSQGRPVMDKLAEEMIRDVGAFD